MKVILCAAIKNLVHSNKLRDLEPINDSLLIPFFNKATILFSKMSVEELLNLFESKIVENRKEIADNTMNNREENFGSNGDKDLDNRSKILKMW